MRTTTIISRPCLFPESTLPDTQTLIATGHETAKSVGVGECSFLTRKQVKSEHEYKTHMMQSNVVMRHAQVGYRSFSKSCQAYKEIYQRLHQVDCPIDRYGLCLDWSMGYPFKERKQRPKGTGLVLESTDQYCELTQQAPVAPHFGDFVMGMPAAFENTCAALAAGSTSIGNLGQYFTYRLPEWDDDVTTTAETVKAIALCAAQPVPILVHSNLDDGFAALFTDLACALGQVLLERYVVNELLGGTISHCYGHTYSEPLARLAFQRALAEVNETPGTMIYGNTTAYGANYVANYANLGSYLLIDVLAQMSKPSGHAVNPVPVTEAYRIPDIQEIVEAHQFANRLIYRAAELGNLFRVEEADPAANRIVAGAKRFKSAVLEGFSDAGVDIRNPFEVLLGMRRIGARKLEEHYGPGLKDPEQSLGRKAIFLAATISELEKQSHACIDSLTDSTRDALAQSTHKVCVATTDVHEYGKLLLETTLRRLDIETFSGGVSTDPVDLVDQVRANGANIIAISTYNGIALSYLEQLENELRQKGLGSVRVYVGGKLNQIADTDNTDDLPIDISEQLHALGAIPCKRIQDMLIDLTNNHTS